MATAIKENLLFEFYTSIGTNQSHHNLSLIKSLSPTSYFKVLQAQVGVLNDERAEEKEFDTFI